jgi:hypothetical protein
VLTDPITVMRGQVRAIDENERFAHNIVNFLLGRTFRHSQDEPSLSQVWSRAENNLGNFVVSVLAMSFGPSDDQWWPQVPLKVRQACASRQQEEIGRGLPLKSFLQILDLKDTIRNNWAICQPYFQAIGLHSGKDKSLDWIDSLNELRRFFAHPLKMELSGYKLPDDDIRKLRDCDGIALRLIQSLSAPS